MQGTYVPKPKQTVEEYLWEWLPSRRHQIRPNSYRHYESTIRNLIAPYIGILPAATLSAGDIEALLNTLADKGYGHGSVIGVLRTLSKAYNDGIRKRFQLHNPVNGVQMLSMKPNISRAVPAEDLAKLYQTASEAPYDLARLMIGAEIGLRPSEITGLKWSDVSGVERSIEVVRQVQRVKGQSLHLAPTKTDRLGAIPITDRQLAILTSHHRHQQLNRAKWKVDQGMIFPNKVGNYMDETCDKEWMRNLCALRLRLPHGLGQHAARHDDGRRSSRRRRRRRGARRRHVRGTGRRRHRGGEWRLPLTSGRAAAPSAAATAMTAIEMAATPRRAARASTQWQSSSLSLVSASI